MTKGIRRGPSRRLKNEARTISISSCPRFDSKDLLEYRKQREDGSKKPLRLHGLLSLRDNGLDDLSENSVLRSGSGRRDDLDGLNDVKDLNLGSVGGDDRKSGIESNDHGGSDGLTGLDLDAGEPVGEETERGELHLLGQERSGSVSSRGSREIYEAHLDIFSLEKRLKGIGEGSDRKKTRRRIESSLASDEDLLGSLESLLGRGDGSEVEELSDERLDLGIGGVGSGDGLDGGLGGGGEVEEGEEG